MKPNRPRAESRTEGRPGRGWGTRAHGPPSTPIFCAPRIQAAAGRDSPSQNIRDLRKSLCIFIKNSQQLRALSNNSNYTNIMPTTNTTSINNNSNNIDIIITVIIMIVIAVIIITINNCVCVCVFITCMYEYYGSVDWLSDKKNWSDSCKWSRNTDYNLRGFFLHFFFLFIMDKLWCRTSPAPFVVLTRK